MEDAARVVDGGEMDCGSGLLLLITRAMRRLEPGQLLGIRSAEPSVVIDLPVWAELVGHTVESKYAETPDGPWLFLIRKAAPHHWTLNRLQPGRAHTDRPALVGLYKLRLQSGLRLLLRSVVSPRRRSGDSIPARLARCSPSSARLGARCSSPAANRSCTPNWAVSSPAARRLERTILTNAMIFGPRPSPRVARVAGPVGKAAGQPRLGHPGPA